MIKAKVDGPTGTFIVMGISADNVRFLKDGRPIVYTPASLHIAPGTTIAGITLFYGETDQELARTMKTLIGPQTEVIVVPRGDDQKQ
jgi:hypothetical protein